MKPKRMEHAVVFKDEHYFAAWPFNGGFWQFADGELAVGFVRGKCDYAKKETVGHGTVDCEHGEHVVLRSRDGGKTWPLGELTTVYTRPKLDELVKTLPASVAADKGYDPRADGYCLIGLFGIPPNDAPQISCALISTDRGRTWSEPIRIRTPGFGCVGGRPSYIVRPDGMLLLFGHGSRGESKDTGGVPKMAVPLVWASWDGGASWGLLGEMELSPAWPGGIMPYPLILDNGCMIATVRRQYDGYNAYTQIYQSGDGGRSWSFLSRVNDWGAPAAIVQLPDKRVVCAYGYRQKPWGVRARVSKDRGATWGDEIILRDDGGSWDLGYPRMFVRPDGKLVTVYYFNSKDDPIQCGGGVRHIAATIWEI